MSMKKLRRLAPLLAVVALAAPGGARATTSSMDFDAYANGSIHNQDGWSSYGAIGTGAGCVQPGYDHQVVDNAGQPWSYPSFGSKSLRISNAYTSGCFGDQTFSKPTNEAGESGAESGGLSSGTRVANYVAQWSFASTSASEQPDMYVVASPDRGDGARMSWIQMADTSAGLEVNFYDYESGSAETGCQTGNNFQFYTLASGLSRTAVHSIRVEMQLIDGPANDVVRVFVDGDLKKTGTSWEDYFRECEGNPSRTVDSILFRTGGAQGFSHPQNLGKGFLIDGVTVSSYAALTSLAADPVVPWAALNLATASATLTANGAGVAGATVDFVAGSTPICSATTDADGFAACAIGPELIDVVFENGYAASFAGDATYAPSAAVAPLVGL